MNKKIFRKVTSTKKITSKAHKKSKLSLKSWMLGGLVLLVALVYGYSQYRPKTLSVIELAGKIEDYITPIPVDINKVTIMSDSPEVNAYVAAAQVKKAAAEKAAKGEPVDQTKLQKDMERAARQAAKETYQSSSADAMGILPTKTSSTGQKSVDLKAVDDAVKTAVDEGVKIANSINFIPGKDDEAGKYEFTPVNNQQVNQSGSCATNNGGAVYAGSTVIGAGDVIFRCTASGWENTNVKCNAAQVKDNTCSINVTVKPGYALNGGANCYDGSIIIGQGQVVDDKDHNKKQCSNGALVDAKKLNGQYLSNEEYDKKFGELKNNCLTNGGSWDKVGSDSSDTYVCGAGDRAKNQAAVKDKYDKCVAAGSAYKWNASTDNCDPITAKSESKVVNSKGTKTGGELTSNDKECLYGAAPATDSNGNKLAGKFNCKDSSGSVPRTYNPAGPGAFSGDNLSSTLLTPEETIKEYSGQYAYRDCMVAANAMGNDAECNVSGTDGTYESYTLSKTTNTSSSKNLKQPGESCAVLGFLWGSDSQCASGICSRRESSDNSGKAGSYCANESGSIPSARVEYPEKSLTECRETLPSDQECVRNPETGYFYRSYKKPLNIQSAAPTTPVNQSNTSSSKNLKQPGESCAVLGFLWGSDSQCASGICSRRESSDNSGKAGSYCANESGSIPSARVEYPEKSLTECRETLPSDQECVRNPETGYFYRSYK